MKNFKLMSMIVLLALVMILAFGCNDQDVDDDIDGDTTDGDTSDGDTVDGDSTDGDTEDGDIEDGDNEDGDTEDGDVTDGDALTVEVAYGEDRFAVDLSGVDSIDVDGEEFALLQAAVEDALPDVDVTTLIYDFVASDGFSPLESPNCTDLIPMSGENLQFGMISLETRNLIWEEDAGYPGCMKVKDLSLIIAMNAK